MAVESPFMIYVERPFGSTLAETMTEIRAWLDHRKIQTTSFQPVSENGGVGFEIGFKSEDEAELFRQDGKQIALGKVAHVDKDFA